MGILNKLSGIHSVHSEHGEMVDHMLEFVHWFMLVLFVGWSAYMCIVLWKFRQKKHPVADYHGVRNHASSHIEFGVVLVEAVLLLGFAFPLWGRRVDVDQFPNDPDVVKVRAVGEKFKWTFHYPGADGSFGRVDHDLMTNANNVLGVDASDPNSKDDKMSGGELVLPVNRRVIIEVSSKDVIHNLALVPMRMAHDATPGIPATMWFKPTSTGEWDIICGQLCGPGHAIMKATLKVVSEKDYEAWLKDAALAAPAAATAPSAPAPPPAPSPIPGGQAPPTPKQ